jgi:hypothetical protein
MKWGLGILFCFGIMGCATTSSEVDLKKINPKERVYIGHFKVNFNGNSRPRCEIYVNADLAPGLKLTDDGLIIYKTDRLAAKFSRIACYHQSSNYYAAWHVHELPLTKLERPENQLEAVYFGDVNIDWTIDEKDTISAAEAAPFEQASPMRIGRVKDSGELKATILNSIEATKVLLRDRAPQLTVLAKPISVEK